MQCIDCILFDPTNLPDDNLIEVETCKRNISDKWIKYCRTHASRASHYPICPACRTCATKNLSLVPLPTKSVTSQCAMYVSYCSLVHHFCKRFREIKERPGKAPPFFYLHEMYVALAPQHLRTHTCITLTSCVFIFLFQCL